MNAARTVLVLSELLVLVAIILSGGCRNSTNAPTGTREHDPNGALESFLATWRGPDVETEQRTRLALSKWQNGVIDREPILLCASAVKSSKTQSVTLSLTAYDEDKDLLGIVVEEERSDANGVSLSEKYPVYVHLRQLDTADARSIGIHLRGKGERKDESRWKEYVCNKEIEETSLKRNARSYRDTMPPVYITVPEPNGVAVWIRLYDGAGNQSTRVKILHGREWGREL